MAHGDVVLDGVAAPPKRGTAPQLSVHVCCGQMAGWTKTPLGTDVDLRPGYIVLGSQLSAKGAQQPPLLDACVATVAYLTYC